MLLQEPRKVKDFTGIIDQFLQTIDLEIFTGGNNMKAKGNRKKDRRSGESSCPKKIRKVLRIREGDPLEIYTGTAGEVILKKYSPISELGQIAESFAETASTVLGLPVLISDTDRFIAASGLRKKDYLNQQIDTALDEIIQCKEKSRTASRLVVPILTNGDPIGSVTVLPTENHALTEAEVKTAGTLVQSFWHARWRVKRASAYGSECPATLRDALCFLLIP